VAISAVEKKLFSMVGKAVKKKYSAWKLTKQIESTMHAAFTESRPERILVLSNYDDFAEKLFKIAGGKSIDSEKLVAKGETISLVKKLNIERYEIVEELKTFAFTLVNIFEQAAPEHGKIPSAYDNFRDDICKLSMIEASRRTPPTPKELPDKIPFIIPHLQNPNLRHEKAWIEQVETRLAEKKQAVICQGAAITGQGGIGKTAMAVAYAYQAAGRYPGGVFWLPMELGLPGAAREFFREAVRHGLSECADFPDLDEPDLVTALILFFNRRPFKLMILDNLEENDLPRELKALADMHLLVTTRRQSVPLPAVEMGLPGEDEAVDIFLAYAGLSRSFLAAGEITAAGKICENVEYLPLAIEILGCQVKYWPLQTLADELPKHIITKETPTCNKACTTIMGSLNLAGHRFKGLHTDQVLKAAAYLSNDQIYPGLISNILTIEHREAVDAVSELAELSILQKGTDIYTIHRLTQEAARMMDEDQQIGEMIADSLDRVIGKIAATGHIKDAYPLLTHVVSIADMASGKQPEDEFPQQLFLSRFGSYLGNAGQYERAGKIIETCLERVKREKGENHPNYASLMNNLAGLYRAQGKYDQAEPLYKRALEIREKALGPDHPDVATTLNNLAGLFEAQGKYDQAEPLYKRALEISEKALGRMHSNTITINKNYKMMLEHKLAFSQD
jgi:tetratricopeptide (TPR) repeat protein